MTQLVQTLNNFSLRPLSLILSAVFNFFVIIGKAFNEALELQALARVQMELRKYKSYRETYDDLSKLTDHELNDIGIARHMIHSVALEAYTDNLVGKK